MGLLFSKFIHGLIPHTATQIFLHAAQPTSVLVFRVRQERECLFAHICRPKGCKNVNSARRQCGVLLRNLKPKFIPRNMADYFCSVLLSGPQEQCILPQSTIADQQPSLVLQLFKRAVDGSQDSRGPKVDISVHSNTSGEQEQ